MYKSKFKRGDVIIPRKDKINTHQIEDYQINDTFIKIDEITKINKTSYYTFYSVFYENNNNYQNPLFPAVDIDNIYEIDQKYIRKKKLNKIIYNTKQNENETH